MNKFSEADRIEQFEKLMNPYVSKEFRNWLIANGFFTAPASIHHHGHIQGRCSIISFAVTKTLLSFTETAWVIVDERAQPLYCGYVP